MESSTPTILRAHCNQCSGPTKHSLVAKREVSGKSDDGSFLAEWGTVYRMLECCGCESVLLRADHWHSDYDMSDEVEYYPPRLSRRPPTWMWQLPNEWRFLLREVYTALQADSKRLAIMGARALIDIYMNDTVGDLGGFQQKLGALVSKGHLSSTDKEILTAALEAGHAAAHRGHSLKEEEVCHVMDIVENLLQRHTLKQSANALLEGIPPRSPKKQEKYD